jgi:tRNA G37 N-methylase TrmD
VEEEEMEGEREVVIVIGRWEGFKGRVVGEIEFVVVEFIFIEDKGFGCIPVK